MFLISPKNTKDDDTKWLTAMANNQILDPKGFAEFLLLKTSRTFALNIQILPAGLRRQVLLAYLFCRMADTLEDDAELPATFKIQLLQKFQNIFHKESNWENQLGLFLSVVPEEWKKSTRWDKLLVANAHFIIPQLHEFSPSVVSAVSSCVFEMCDGMVEFTSKVKSILIQDMRDLDEYCYYVAGTVGNLLSKLFVLHSPLITKNRSLELNSLSVSFGLGLQLTNILKDIEDDRERNVSFIPHSLLEKENLTAVNFLDPLKRAQAQRIMGLLIQKAKAHLQDALKYTCLLPRMEPRLRLFCLWPLFMAVETLALLADRTQAEKKISRDRVKNIVLKTSLACWSNTWLNSMFNATVADLELQMEKI